MTCKSNKLTVGQTLVPKYQGGKPALVKKIGTVMSSRTSLRPFSTLVTLTVDGVDADGDLSWVRSNWRT